MSERRYQVEAYAKINLGLKVLYRRPDQFHEIRTIFQTISLSDTVELIWEPGRRTKITLDDPLAIPDNLMVRAAHLVLEKAKKTGSVRMRLTKRIPMGGGLGGGSTDAAAVIRCLASSFRQPLEFDTCVELAASLGSDIPFFLLGGAVLAMGRGEEMYPLPDLPPTTGLLVCPAVHVSTPRAYQALKRRTWGELTVPSQSRILNKFQALARSVAEKRSAAEWAHLAENDFEAAVFLEHPLLPKLKRMLERQGARPAQMSGSGSALFGLFSSWAEAKSAQEAFDAGVRTVPIRLLGRRRYAARWRQWLGAAAGA